MRPLHQREKLFAAICVLTTMVFLVIVGVIRPLNNFSIHLSGMIKDEQGKLRKNSALIARSEALETRFKDYHALLHIQGSREEAISRAISSIEKTAAENDIHITELKPKTMNVQDNFNVFPVSLVFDAPLDKITDFIATLQQKPLYFSIETLDVVRQGARDNPDLRVNLTLFKIFTLEP